MKRVCLCFFLLSLLFGCNQDPVDISEEKKEEALLSYHIVYLTKEGEETEYPDAGARLYLYYGLEAHEFTGISWEGEGVLMQGDSLAIYPDVEQTADEEGNAAFYIPPRDFNRPFCIFVESNYYKEIHQPTVSYYPGWQTSRSTHLIFTVPTTIRQ